MARSVSVLTMQAKRLDLEILVSSVLRSHGFAVSPATLSVHVDKSICVDFHPPNMLLYVELDVARGYAYNVNINVNPRCRHRGIGRKLSAANEEICREAKLIILINNNQNPGFWQRRGYRRLNPFQRMLNARRLAIPFRAHSVYKTP
jgi:ribosomal protein S18 acetylase RimI-like enzyme